jgi:hypothetical protein
MSSPRWWQWPTVLSLDAPAVVIVWQWLLAALAGVPLRWPEVFVVGASVWMAYAADRWFEAARLPPATIRTARHRFYGSHRTGVAVTWSLVLVADVVVAVAELSRRELAAGGILLIPTLLYVLSHQLVHRESRWRVPKEVCVAGLIAAGASVFVFAAPGVYVRPLLSAVALFSGLCFANMMLISSWEQAVDEMHGQDSLVRQFRHGVMVSRTLPLILTAIAAVGAEPYFGIPAVAAHCVAASGLLLALIDHYERKLGWPVARVLADVVLLTPLLPLLRGLRG